MFFEVTFSLLYIVLSVAIKACCPWWRCHLGVSEVYQLVCLMKTTLLSMRWCFGHKWRHFGVFSPLSTSGHFDNRTPLLYWVKEKVTQHLWTQNIPSVIPLLEAEGAEEKLLIMSVRENMWLCIDYNCCSWKPLQLSSKWEAMLTPTFQPLSGQLRSYWVLFFLAL